MDRPNKEPGNTNHETNPNPFKGPETKKQKKDQKK